MQQPTPKLFEIKIFCWIETYFLISQNGHFIEAHMTSSSRDSVVNIVDRLRAGRPVIRIPGEARHFVLFQNVQIDCAGCPATCTTGKVGFIHWDRVDGA